MAEICARMLAVLLLPLLAALTVASDAGTVSKLGMWVTWLVLAVAADAFAGRVRAPPGGERFVARALPLAALLLHTSVLAYALWVTSARPAAPGQLAVAALALGISAGTTGVSASHELVHRRSRSARTLAQLFMLLVSYPHFPQVHLRVHHRYVGTPLDPGTSRRNEALPNFLVRAYVLSWRSAWRVECARLRRRGLSPWRSENALLRAVAMQLGVYVLLAFFASSTALALFVAQAAVAMVTTLAVDYTQHYGVIRRELAPHRLPPVRTSDAWTTDHASNRSTFNLGLHAAHHLQPGRAYTLLEREPRSLQAPCGYPGLLLLALVPPLWFRVMNRRLAASEVAQ